MYLKQYILSIVTLLVTIACSTEDLDFVEPAQRRPVKVGFCVGGSGDMTRTEIGENGQRVNWSQQDSIALWAKNTNGEFAFQGRTFNQWFISANNSKAYFISELQSPMEDGQYTYYVCYPTPQSVNGTIATFTIPANQDGKISAGAGIMVGKGEGEALKPLITQRDPTDDTSVGDYLIKDSPNLTMRNLVHALRFYVPQAHWGFGDETIERIVFTMPINDDGGTIAGTVTADVTSVDIESLSNPENKVVALDMTANGSSSISLNLVDPIGKSTVDALTGAVDYDFACAAIMPGTYGGEFTAKVYSRTKVSQAKVIAFNDRVMASNHITPVALNCLDVKVRPKIEFRINSNNLGENPYKITLTADTSTKWRGGDDHIYEYDTGSESTTIAVGGGFVLYSEDEVLSTISGKTVTVRYETKSAIVSQTITMPTLSAGGSHTILLDVPWLMYQDFSNVGDYNDEATTSSKTLEGSGLPGWTASRSRSSVGSHIRLRPFYALIGRAQGRLDSELFGERLKPNANVDVIVTFNAGAEKVNTPLQVGKTTNTGAIKASEEIESISETINLVKGSHSSIPERSCTVTGVTKNHRLSWRTNITSGSWGTYSDTPIDNIKVKITN